MLAKLLLATLFVVLSIAALYSYERFAERSLGASGTALPMAADAPCSTACWRRRWRNARARAARP